MLHPEYYSGWNILLVETYTSLLLNVRKVTDVRQKEIHTAEPLVLDPSLFEVKIALVKLKRCESSGGNQILAELIQAGGKTRFDIHKLNNSVWNKEELPDHWKE
jgi:hypothetical protein